MSKLKSKYLRNLNESRKRKLNENFDMPSFAKENGISDEDSEKLRLKSEEPISDSELLTYATDLIGGEKAKLFLDFLGVDLNEATEKVILKGKSQAYKDGDRAYHSNVYQRDNPYTSSAEKKDWDAGWTYAMQLDATSNGKKRVKFNESVDDTPKSEEEAKALWNGASVEQRKKLLSEYSEGLHFAENDWDSLIEQIKNIVTTGYKIESLSENEPIYSAEAKLLWDKTSLEDKKKFVVDNNYPIEDAELSWDDLPISVKLAVGVKHSSLNEADEDPLKEGDKVKILKDGDLKGKEGKVVAIYNGDSAIRDFIIDVDGKEEKMQTGDFYNMSESKKLLFENKEVLTKSDLANVLSLNAVNGRKFSESDISDDILSKFNSKWSSLYKTNPNFDPFGLDVELEDADVFDDFMDLLVSLGKSDSKVSLFESDTVVGAKKLGVFTKLFEKNSSKLGSKTGKEFVALNENLKNVKNKIKDNEIVAGQKAKINKNGKGTLPF